MITGLEHPKQRGIQKLHESNGKRILVVNGWILPSGLVGVKLVGLFHLVYVLLQTGLGKCP